jgi:hypothetical protein
MQAREAVSAVLRRERSADLIGERMQRRRRSARRDVKSFIKRQLGIAPGGA